ncbi:MAG: CocE/NonD family hydrolase [Candidatus Rokubacteria bacterium]|nr:CocE/NonD family hydrolase [Candidatus Rokubacteria bacterium]
MRTVTALPRPIREIENTWIRLSDGCRLAARIWLPEDADARPVPGILEYIPYRKRDVMAQRDALIHPYLAGHGYACVRVDLRGSGDSDGVLTDEYLKLEQDDACEVIAWIAAQPWCTGTVGMMGTSWGGFNALQVAARRPPALKAIITSCSTDDRYADDVHYMGGTLLLDNLRWASIMFSHNSRPPDPAIVGERWRDLWMQRLEGSGLWLDPWLRHQRRDAYWRHGSVCEDFAAIACPVYAVGGWADAYTNAIPRLMRGLAVPRQGLIGPWAHRYPHMALPGPAVGFLQLARHWWDTWLKGIDTPGAREPLLRIWMQESVPPAHTCEVRPGRWVAESEWPSPRIKPLRLVLNRGGLDATPGREVALPLRSPETVGLHAGRWCAHGTGPDLPTDQRGEDGGALVFDTEPLPERLEILGAPVVELLCAADRPVALVAVRLSDVAPDGAATRVSYGLLNLTHRDSHATPAALTPGHRYRVRIPLNDVAQAFPPGHRLRLALSTAYWPIAWPAPEPVTLTVWAGASVLELPVRAPDPADAQLPPLPPPEAPPPLRTTVLEAGRTGRMVHHDVASGVVTQELLQDSGRYRLDDIDLTLQTIVTERYDIRPEDPLSARAEVASTVRMQRGDWRVETRTRTRLTATRAAFGVQATLDAFEGDARVFCRSWNTAVPRDLV